MKTENNAQRLEDRLRLLWRERARLTSAQWTELYQMVHRLLRGKCSDLVARFPGTADEFIQDFFQDKVLLSAGSGAEINHSGVVVMYYRRYLLDRLDRVPSRPTPPNGGGDDNGAVNVGALAADRMALEAFLASLDGSSLEQLLDLLAATMRGADPDPAVAEAVRMHLGVDLDVCTDAARNFLDGTGDWTGLLDDLWWIRPYLAKHFCADADDRLSLSDLQRRHQIASHHHKAVKLGISVPKGQGAAMAKFLESYRGQWLISLGIPLNETHWPEMAVALKILCLVALYQQEHGTRGT